MRTLSTVESIESILDEVSESSDEKTHASVIRARTVIASFLASAIARHIEHHLGINALIRFSEDLVRHSRKVAFGGEKSGYERTRFLHALFSFLLRLEDYFSAVQSLSDQINPKIKDRNKFDKSLNLCKEITSKIRRTLSVSYEHSPTPYGDIDMARISYTYRRLLKSMRSLRDSIFDYEEFFPNQHQPATGASDAVASN